MKYTIYILVAILFTSCQNNVEEEPDKIDCTESVSYINTIKPIIDSNCLECHNGGQSPNLSTYNNIKENAVLINEQTFSKSMPKNGSLTTEEIEAIYCWVKDGALNN